MAKFLPIGRNFNERNPGERVDRLAVVDRPHGLAIISMNIVAPIFGPRRFAGESLHDIFLQTGVHTGNHAVTDRHQ
jgi:hypothetical protein